MYAPSNMRVKHVQNGDDRAAEYTSRLSVEQVTQDLAIEQQDVAYQEVVDYLTEARQGIALKLITRRVPLNGSVIVKCCTVEGKRHLRLSWFRLLASTGALSSPFSVQPYASGGLMLVMGDGFVDQPALSKAVGELKRWAGSAQVTSTSDFCDVEEHDNKQALLVHAAEARLESKLGLLARTIADRHAEVGERAGAREAAPCQRARLVAPLDVRCVQYKPGLA
jgi:hypothetical protein